MHALNQWPARFVLVCLAASACFASAAQAASISPRVDLADIDRTVARAMETFSVPGVAIGIVKDGHVILAKGYGVREQGKPERVDPDTVFAIGSLTKAFTTAALAILVDEGKLHWNDRVIDHLPQFRLADPYVTREFTVLDLLTHRSGLGLGAGDLMFVPETDFTRAEIMQNLRYLPFVSSFRSTYAYDNLLYAVAGEIVPAVTGTSWEDFVEARILQRLGMTACATTSSRLKNTRNMAAPHAVIDGKLIPVAVMKTDQLAPAGAIHCNVNGMAKWAAVQLAGGKLPDGSVLFSETQHAAMWQPQTITPLRPEIGAATRGHFSAYGLGWQLRDFEGYELVTHSGGLLGMVLNVSLIPELNLGVIVLTNQQSGEALRAIDTHVLAAYTGAKRRDWVAFYKQMADQKTDKNLESEKKAQRAGSAEIGAPPLPLSAYVGTYHDAWRGDVTIRQEGNRLVLKFSRTERMEGFMEHNGRGIFVVRWNDRSLSADAYVRFSLGFDGEVEGMKMQAVSPRTDFSFDFQDLDFHKVRASAPR